MSCSYERTGMQKNGWDQWEKVLLAKKKNKNNSFHDLQLFQTLAKPEDDG